MTDAWPVAILPPGAISRRIAARSLSGTVSLSGFTQRIAVPASAWLIAYENIPVTTPERIRTWDGLEASLDGGAVPILVPLVEGDMAPAATGTMVGAAAVGATVVTIAKTGDQIQAGHHFSIGERLYRVAKVILITGNDHQVSIRPPLREAVANGATVDFGDLKCKCRLASDDEMNLVLRPPRLGFASVRFVEDPN